MREASTVVHHRSSLGKLSRMTNPHGIETLELGLVGGAFGHVGYKYGIDFDKIKNEF